MSLVGVLMLIGIADSNSILIVDFAHKLEAQGTLGSRRHDHRVPRPCVDPDDLLATIIGLAPMALKLGTGGGQYIPMAHFAMSAGLTSRSCSRSYRSGRLFMGLWKERQACTGDSLYST